MLEVVGDALIEALAYVSIILRRARFAVVYRIAALRAAAMSNAWSDVLVIGIRDREFVVEVVIEAE